MDDIYALPSLSLLDIVVSPLLYIAIAIFSWRLARKKGRNPWLCSSLAIFSFAVLSLIITFIICVLTAVCYELKTSSLLYFSDNPHLFALAVIIQPHLQDLSLTFFADHPHFTAIIDAPLRFYSSITNLPGGFLNFFFAAISFLSCFLLARKKGRNPWGWGIWGLFCCPVVFIILLIAPSYAIKEEEHSSTQ